jgi:hypothetical protein
MKPRSLLSFVFGRHQETCEGCQQSFDFVLASRVLVPARESVWRNSPAIAPHLPVLRHK